MTDENQNPGGETPSGSEAPKSEFLSGETGGSETKFDTDEVSKLAKMNADAQSFIKTLQSETAEMRNEIKALQEELGKAKTMDDLINTYGQHDNTAESKTPQVDEQQLLAKLKAEMFAELSAEQQKAQEESNWREALQQAEAKFGEKYGNYVDDRAKELGISADDMRGYAKTSPKVFMELLGGSTQSASPTQPSLQAPTGGQDDIKARYARYVRLQAQDSSEGREAKRMLKDPVFLEQYRLSIISGK